MKRVVTLVVCLGFCASSQQAPRRAPYKAGPQETSVFSGPAEHPVEPGPLQDIRIGFYGPTTDTHPDAVVWKGAALAIEEANRAGGYRGKPFRLIAGWSADPWRGGAAGISRLAFVDRVWAIVAAASGDGAHLAAQVSAKALLPVVNALASDRTLHVAGLPWMFSIVPGDDQHALVIGEAVRQRSIVIVSSTEHDSRAFLGYLLASCRRVKADVRMHLQFNPAAGDLREVACRAGASNPDAIVIVAAAADSAALVQHLRASGHRGVIVGGPQFGRSAFARQAGTTADRVQFPWVGAASPEFRRRYAQRYGAEDPDDAAAGGYDAVTLLVRAIRSSGLSRTRIRAALAALPAWEGASGRIEWDRFGQNSRPPQLATFGSGVVMRLK